MIPSLARLLEELAAAEPDVEAVAADAPADRAADGAADARMTWSRGGRIFAVASGGGVELRLDPAIAAAAARTPDAGPSPRGPEWVRFNPRELDGHAVDRVAAWFELAHRFAAPPGS